MKKLKNLFLVLSAALLLVSCGSGLGGLNGDNQTTAPGSGNDNSGSNGGTDNGGNNGGSGNGGSDNDEIKPENLKGSIWAGPYKPSPSQTSAVKIKSDTELVYDQCPGFEKAIQYVKTEQGSKNLFRIFTYVKEGDKFRITGVKDGKDNPNSLAVFYFENGKLIIKNTSDQVVVSADLHESMSDAEEKKYILDEINKFRKSAGVSPVTDANGPHAMNCPIKVANKRVEEIKTLFEHTRPNGAKLETIFQEVKECQIVPPSAHGEIIAQESSAVNAMNAWKASEGHAAAMKNSNFNYAAVAKSGRFYVVFFIRQ